jgi:hypothetical protein
MSDENFARVFSFFGEFFFARSYAAQFYLAINPALVILVVSCLLVSLIAKPLP